VGCEEKKLGREEGEEMGRGEGKSLQPLQHWSMKQGPVLCLANHSLFR